MLCSQLAKVVDDHKVSTSFHFTLSLEGMHLGTMHHTVIDEPSSCKWYTWYIWYRWYKWYSGPFQRSSLCTVHHQSESESEPEYDNATICTASRNMAAQANERASMTVRQLEMNGKCDHNEMRAINMKDFARCVRYYILRAWERSK